MAGGIPRPVASDSLTKARTVDPEPVPFTRRTGPAVALRSSSTLLAGGVIQRPPNHRP